VGLGHRVEQRLLVLLQVAVVRERETLEGASSPVRLPMRRPALPRASSATSGFFFWGSIELPGGERVVEDREPELLGGPHHHLLTDAGQVDPEEGKIEEGLGHEVAVGHRVERILETRSESELLGHAVRVEGQRRPGQGSRPRGRHVQPIHRGQQSVDVPGQRPCVRQQVVGEEHRLGALEMGVARGDRLSPASLALVTSTSWRAMISGRHLAQLALGVEPQIGGDLVVAAPPGVQFGADVAGDLGHPSLDGGVDVLVVRERRRTPHWSARPRPGRGRPAAGPPRRHPGVPPGPGPRTWAREPVRSSKARTRSKCRLDE
jgi:hypothetical protein